METIIFIAIAVIISIIQNRADKAKKNSQQPPPAWRPRRDESSSDAAENDDDENMDEEAPPTPRPFAARKLQEYIKQFEAAQREAAQGTLEPAMPPPIPERKHHHGDSVTLREIAEVVVQLDFVDIEFLMEEFDMTEGTAMEVLIDLQRHRIVGRDMGEGECDVLVHDITELNNLLSREPKETPHKPEPSISQAASDKQNQLKILEERARKAREEAAAAARQSDAENGYTGVPAEIADPLTKRTAVRSISRESARRGFIWGKIIDEPRFKRRWSPAHR